MYYVHSNAKLKQQVVELEGFRRMNNELFKRSTDILVEGQQKSPT